MDGERLKKLAAFAAIYFIWGSTYLAIRYAIETIPPFFMIGIRAFLSGGILYGWARLRGSAPPTARDWLWASVTGVLLFAGGQGLLAYAMTRVPSGASALVIGTIPLWMTLLQAAREGRSTLGGPVIPGLVLGFTGVALLVEPSRLLGGQPIDPLGAVVLISAAISWSFGSIIGRHARLPESISMTTGMMLLTGSTFLLAGSIAGGEAGAILETAISARSLGGLIYQLVLGSIVAFGCYTWLLRVSTPSRVSTYAFVNPLVAVFLGWILGSEELTARIGVATALMVGAVALINIAGGRKRGATPAPAGSTVKGRPGKPLEAAPPALDPEEA